MDAPIAYPPDAVLTGAEVARWLRVSPDTVQRLPIKCAPLGRGEHNRRRRYLARHVLEYLEQIAV